MNYIKDIQLYEDNHYNAIIEIPKNTSNKYELIEPSNCNVECVRKVIGKYPFYYGCFPQTLAGDNDPLDVIIFSNKKRHILDCVAVKIIGVIKTIDYGDVDDKILAIPVDDAAMDLQKQIKIAMKFLKSYKGKNADTQIDETIYSIDTAIYLINKSHDAYMQKASTKSKALTSF